MGWADSVRRTEQLRPVYQVKVHEKQATLTTHTHTGVIRNIKRNDFKKLEY